VNASQKQLEFWRNNVTQFARDMFKVEPDKWQKKVYAAFSDTNDPKAWRISMQACAGPGKTHALAVCIWNFMLCYSEEGYHPNGAAMSCDSDNLRDGLWKELNVLMQRSDLIKSQFVFTTEKIYAKGFKDSWFMSARTFPKTANPEEKARALSGLHAKYILYVIDESGDQYPGVLRTCEQGLSNCAWGKILTAGNTTSQTGILHFVSQQQPHMWTVIEITGDPDDPDRSPRVDIKWAREQIKIYGRHNPWVMAYILGKFPPGGINQILTLDDVKAAMSRHLREDQYSWAQKRLGVDVARFGDDRSVIFPRQGMAAFHPHEMRGARTTDIAARVSLAMSRWAEKSPGRVEAVYIDDTGHWGHGVIDNLIAQGNSPVGVVFHAAALDDRYRNRRTEMWLEMAKAVKAGMALPPIDDLIPELTVPTYSFHNGKFWIEEKDQIKLRLKRSPDLADALALTFAVPDQPRESSLFPYAEADERQKVRTDFNPYPSLA
jgi:phage terminase large subunit